MSIHLRHSYPLPASSRQHSPSTDFPRQAPTQPCSLHTLSHPPAPTLYVALWGASPTHCSLSWVPKGEDSREGMGTSTQTPGWSVQDPARPLRIAGGGIIDGPKKDWTQRVSFPLAMPRVALSQPHTLGACPAQGSADESNAVSKLN